MGHESKKFKVVRHIESAINHNNDVTYWLDQGWTIISASNGLFVLQEPAGVESADDHLPTLRATKKIHDELCGHIRKLSDHVLGPDYYNEGMDSYTCNAATFRDLKREFDKLRLFRWIFGGRRK